MTLARPLWRALSWLMQKIFLDPLDLRLRDLERVQKEMKEESKTSMSELHIKMDRVMELMHSTRPQSSGHDAANKEDQHIQLGKAA